MIVGPVCPSLMVATEKVNFRRFFKIFFLRQKKSFQFNIYTKKDTTKDKNINIYSLK